MTRSLSIAVVCYPGLGGSGVVAAELALALAARGHRIHVVASAVPERLRARGAAAADAIAPGITFERVEVPASPVFEHGPYDVAVASHLVELVRRAPVDLVHLHYAVPHAASALLAGRVLGPAAPAMVVTLHGTDVTRLGAHPSLHPVIAFAVAAADGVTAPSRYLAGVAAERFGIPAERIEVLPNFVDLARFRPPPGGRDRVASGLAALFSDGAGEGPILFHVSNFRPIKRPLDLIDVLARVRRTLPARAVLVGDGPERDAVAARARELGVGDAVCMLGRRDDFCTLLGHADGFVLPSENEGFGVAALEAMAAGVPVFGYRVGGLPEVVGEGAGVLVPCGDVDALAQAVVEGVGDRAVRDDLGRAARARAEAGFGRDAAAVRYESYFHDILSRRAAPATPASGTRTIPMKGSASI
ncbi:MAG TPA: N-acetyl-alpha-D-glucosaminyl L-malate synthase BshA [Kofleriaceae bacterium]|nr:N-acetyl-alpha-D-glucosaminyl L-malate synthase BshA [Kofleriaceae bacterium]